MFVGGKCDLYHYAMIFSRYLLLSALAFVFLILPLFSVQAQIFPGDEGSPGLVPCGDPTDANAKDFAAECQLCHLENLSRDLLQLAIYVAVFLATLAIAYAGFRMITAQGDTSAVTAAKDILVKAVLGLVFVLAAWLIIDTLMKFFYSGGARWNDFGACIPQPAPKAQPKPGGVSVVPQPVPNNCTVDEMEGVTCPQPDPAKPAQPGTGTQSELLQTLRGGGISVNSNVILEGVNKELTNTLISVCTETNRACTVTAAKNGQHENACHAQGTCFDVVCTNCGSSKDLDTFIKNAQAKGYCAVYEPGPDKKTGTPLPCPAGVSMCRAGVGTGSHFSFYTPTGPRDALCGK